VRLSNKKVITEPGIDVMETVEIGGIQQVMYSRGENRENPVVLYIHGGPGSPSMPLLHDWQYPLEEHFTFVHWDQRNSGKTFFLNNPEAILKTLTFEQVLTDAYEVAQHIKNRFNKEEITVLGHSWGSILGTALVQTHPKLFNAYIGVGQVVNMIDNERVGFEVLLERAQADGNEEHIKAIKSLAPYPPPDKSFDEGVLELIMEVRNWQAKYGLAASVSIEQILTLLFSPHYRLKEKLNYRNALKNQMPLLKSLFDKVDTIDIHKFGLEYAIPVFYILGDKDYQTPHTLARTFFDKISAPQKEFFLIPNAGHNAMHDKTDEFNRILLEKIRPKISQQK